MTDQTKNRLQERFKQLLDATDQSQYQSPRTLFEIEELTLELREKLTQATLEEISREAQEQAEQEKEQEKEKEEPTSKICCPDCHRNAWFKGERSRSVVTRTGILVLTRRYYYCRRCKQGVCPLDHRFALPVNSDFTMPVVQ